MNQKEKNGLVKFVDKLFRDKNQKSIKKYLIVSSIIGLAFSVTLSVTLPIILKNETIQNQDENYYKFEDKYFSSKEEIYKYSSDKAKQNNYSFETSKFILDDNVFSSKNKLNEYIKNKFNIKKDITKNNPNNYLINSSGELSPLVKTSDYEKNIKVYKGVNGDAYTSENDAKESFINNYRINYQVDGDLFDNTFSAREYYLKKKIFDLEKQIKKEVCYEQGGICQTKEEIKSWLRNNIEKGFEYNGKDFSNLNYTEFLNAMRDLDDDIINTHVKNVFNANKSSYWVTQNTSNPLGYFVGPKYFESKEKVSNIAKFEAIESYDVNYFMSYFVAIPAIGMLINSFIESKESSQKTYNMKDYLDNILNKNEIIEIKSIIKKLSPNQLDSLSEGLNDINDPEFSSFYKLLVSFKRLIEISKIFGIEKIETKNLESLIQQTVISILNKNKDFINGILNTKNNKESLSILNKLSFEDIYSLFLNTSNFFNKGGVNKVVWDLTQNFLNKVDKVMNAFGDGVNAASDLIGLFSNDKKKSNKNDKKLSDTLKKKTAEIWSKLHKKNGDVLKALGMQDYRTKERAGPIVIMKAISTVWSLGKIMSFISLKTYEAKLDSNQSLYYFEPTIKIPFTNITFGGSVQDQEIKTLIDTPLKYFNPKNNGKEINELYEFNGKYYHEKSKAIKDLKYEIFKKPEDYLKTKKILTSVISKDNTYKLNLPQVCNGDEKQKNCISNYEYNRRFAQEKEKFIENLFNRFYENSKKEYFLDGFGGAHTSKEIAMNELKRKADKSENYKRVYIYMLNNNRVIKNRLKDIKEFIRNNQPLEYKNIINTDLIKTNHFDSLKENNNYTFDIWKVNFYGQEKYFRSQLELWKFLENKLNYKVMNYTREETTHVYNNIEFIKKEEFINWINNQIVEVRKQKNN